MIREGRALADLNALLNRYEANPDSNRLSINPQRADFDTQAELDDYVSVLANAGAAGALLIEPRKGRERNSPPRARLIDAKKLYMFLGREPSAAIASDAISLVRVGEQEPWLIEAIEEVETAWRRGKTWWAIGPADAETVALIAKLATSIVAEQHHGMDYRTLSVQVVGDSKFLERHEGPLVRFISFARPLPAGSPRSVLSSLGLDRIAVPLHLSGPLVLGSCPIPQTVPYIAVPHSSVGEIGFSRQPRCLLTIENFVSFHRHALEANTDHTDLVVYTGGQPSLSWQQSMVELKSRLPENLPVFHWSDIDAGGLEIFRKIEGLLGRVRPHLMSPEVASEHGYLPASPVVRSGQFAGTGIHDLAEYLAGPAGRCIEQETLMPCAPVC
jgi:hypothetical protein